MRKKIFKVLAVVALMMSMSMTVLADGSIVGAVDMEQASATDKNGNPVRIIIKSSLPEYTKGEEQNVVNAIVDKSDGDTTVKSAFEMAGADWTQIDRYDKSQVVEEHVDLGAYKFLTSVYDISFEGITPTADNPIKVKFVVTNMTDNMVVDVLHYCSTVDADTGKVHGWEILTGTKLSSTELEAEFHSASPIALIYKLKPTNTGSEITSPKTADVSVVPMMAASVSMAVAGVAALKKSKENE